MQQFGKTHRRSGSDFVVEFKEMTRRDAETGMSAALENLILTAPDSKRNELEKQFEGFKILFRRYLDEMSTQIKWDNIELLNENEVKPYGNLPDINPNRIKEYLDKLIVIKLNGGLGTSMGCTGPKSLITVRSDLTFLDLTVQQIETLNNKYKCDIPLVIMNSFNTQEDTLQVLRKYNKLNVTIETFEQSMYPRIHRESLQPIAKKVRPNSIDLKNNKIKEDQDESWYPPGHGDIYRSLLNSGILDKHINEGKELAFISNIDNMGAIVDLRILSFLIESMKDPNYPEFVMEVTDKTRADVKGGTLVKYENKLRLLEMAQVPKDRKEEFASVRKFKIFNTNNLWVNLRAMNRAIQEDTLHMEVIVNLKTLDNGTNVVQLEEAAGSAIKSFNHAIGINVPRHRFLPVKQSADLMLVMSNLYEMRKGCLIMSSNRSFPSVPLVKLGPHFNRVKDFLNRFSNIPSMLELDHLTVSGDVFFGKDVVLKGTVIIIANHGDRIDIPPGAILDNKIVSGNLRILDH